MEVDGLEYNCPCAQVRELDSSHAWRPPRLMRITGADGQAEHAPFRMLSAVIARGMGSWMEAVASRRAQPPRTTADNGTPRVVFFSGDPCGTTPRVVRIRDFLNGTGFDGEVLYVAQSPLLKTSAPLLCCPPPPPQADVLRAPPPERGDGEDEDDEDEELDDGDADDGEGSGGPAEEEKAAGEERRETDTRRKRRRGDSDGSDADGDDEGEEDEAEEPEKQQRTTPPPPLAPWRAHLWMSSPAGPHILSGAHYDDEDNLLCVLPAPVPAPPPAAPARAGTAAAAAATPPQASVCDSSAVAAPRHPLGSGAKLVCLWPPELGAAMAPHAPAGEWANHSALSAADLLEEDEQGEGLFAPLLRPTSSSLAGAATAAATAGAGAGVAAAAAPSPSPRSRRRPADPPVAAPPRARDEENDNDDNDDGDGGGGWGGPEAAALRRRRFRACARPAALRFLVRPGEALFIPAGWWHAVLSEPGTLAVNYWWAPPPPPARAEPETFFDPPVGPGYAAPPPPASLYASDELALRSAFGKSAESLALLAARAVARPLLRCRGLSGDDGGDAKSRPGAAAAGGQDPPLLQQQPQQERQRRQQRRRDDDADLECEAAKGWNADEGWPAASFMRVIAMPPSPAPPQQRRRRRCPPRPGPPPPPKPFLCLSHPLGWTFRLDRCREFLALSLLRAEARAVGAAPLLGPPTRESATAVHLLCAAAACAHGNSVACLTHLFERGGLTPDDMHNIEMGRIRGNGTSGGPWNHEEALAEERRRRRLEEEARAADGAAPPRPMAGRVLDAALASPLAAFLLSRVLDAQRALLGAREQRRVERDLRRREEGLGGWGKHASSEEEEDDDDEFGSSEEWQEDLRLDDQIWGAFYDDFFDRWRAQHGRRQQQQQQEGRAQREQREQRRQQEHDALAEAKQNAFDAIMRQNRLLLRIAARAAAAGAGAI